MNCCNYSNNRKENRVSKNIGSGDSRPSKFSWKSLGQILHWVIMIGAVFYLLFSLF